MESENLTAFRQALDIVEEPGGLFSAGLRLSSIHVPEMDAASWSESALAMDILVRDAAGAIEADFPADDRERLAALARFMVEAAGFRGNREDYHAPLNSCLASVVETRVGLPISLSIVFCEVARRLGLDVFGVATPGHYIAGARVDGGFCFISIFDGPEVLDPIQAAELVSRVSSVPVERIVAHLVPAPPRDTIRRMLNNLKIAYATASDFPRLIRTLDWMLAMEPENRIERRNRGLIHLRIGNRRFGAQDLLEYVKGPVTQDELEVIQEEAHKALRPGKDE